MGRIRAYIRSNILGLVAIFIALSGSAYAANTVGSADVINDSLMSADLQNNAAVGSADVIDDTVTGGGLASGDLRGGSVGTSELQNNGVTSADIKDDTRPNGGLTISDLQDSSVGASEIADGSITSADVHDIDEYFFEGGLEWQDLSAGSVNSVQVQNNSLDTTDIDERFLEDVPIGGYKIVQGASKSAPGNNTYTDATVDCPDDTSYATPRKRVVLGGGYSGNYGLRAVVSYPLDADTWKVTVFNDYGVSDATIQPWAVCAYSEFFSYPARNARAGD